MVSPFYGIRRTSGALGMGYWFFVAEFI